MLERRAGHANRASHRTDPRSREGTRTAHPASEKRGSALEKGVAKRRSFEPREPTVGNDCWSQYVRKGAAETAGELDYDGSAYQTRNDRAPVDGSKSLVARVWISGFCLIMGKRDED